MIGIIFAALIGISAAQVCPPSAVLYPCTCKDSDTKEISCEYILYDSFNLKGVLDNASALVNDSVIFDQLTISWTFLSEIEEGAIQHLKFKNVFIGYNSKLTYISPRAFNESRDITTYISLWFNPIENEAPYERDVFDLINSFKNLEEVALLGSRVSSIPDGAFQNMTSLQSIYIYNNNISSIGSKAFSATPRLELLWLDENSITSESVHGDSFDGIGSLAEVDLSCNLIDYMNKDSFQPLLDQAASVIVGGTAICLRPEYRRLHCDERADWICDSEERYRSHLSGFICKAGTGPVDIWDYCGGRNSTLQV